jgi:phospholipid transport system substrate-binding protein
MGADEAPDVLIKRLSDETLGAIKADKSIRSGDIDKIIALVDSKIMPNVNFQRMTAAAVGPAWRQATPSSRSACRKSSRPCWCAPTRARCRRSTTRSSRSSRCAWRRPTRKSSCAPRSVAAAIPIQLDYRLEKTPGEGAGWKIYNLNVLGVWLVETYRSQFAQEVNAKGIDGLITTLAERNKTNAGRKKS